MSKASPSGLYNFSEEQLLSRRTLLHGSAGLIGGMFARIVCDSRICR
jgi:hypothetical protein